MVLATRDAVAEEEDFVTFATVKASKIIQIKEGTDNFNQNEKRMAMRHADTHGDFIVDDFEIQFLAGDNNTEIIYEIPGGQNSQNPLAFLNGYRLEHKIPAAFNMPKPLSFIAKTDEKLTVAYKGYLTFDNTTSTDANTALGNFDFGYDNRYGLAQQINLIDSDGNVIGTTRLKSFVSTGKTNKDGYRAHLFDARMNPNQNFRDTRKLQTAAMSVPAADTVPPGSGIIPVTSNAGSAPSGQTIAPAGMYIEEPRINPSIFRIPGERCKSVNLKELSFTIIS